MPAKPFVVYDEVAEMRQDRANYLMMLWFMRQVQKRREAAPRGADNA